MIERIEFSRPPDLPGVEVLLVEHSARRWRAFHETYTVSTGLKLRGPEFEWRYRRDLYRSDAGNIMLMEPGEVHANTKPTASADFGVMFISPAIIERAAINLGLGTATPHLRAGLAPDRTLFTAFARLHESLEGEATALERQSRFVSCVRLLLERWTESSPRAVSAFAGHPGLTRARAFVQEHYRENITLDDLASAAGLSRFHLVRAFVAEFGLPPHAYQLHPRLARGRASIAAGRRPPWLLSSVLPISVTSIGISARLSA